MIRRAPQGCLIRGCQDSLASGDGITRLYVRSDPLPRMREWLGRLDVWLRCIVLQALAPDRPARMTMP
jgi:hypothetical protein